MGVPNIFEPGEVASSAEVNQNFDHLSALLGDGSNGDELRPPGPILLNEVGQLAARDKTFLQIGWNINQYLDGTTPKVERIESGKRATALRIGEGGFEVWTTGTTDGDLQTQLVKVFAISAREGTDYMFFSPWWHMTVSDGQPQNHGDYRLTYVPLKEPRAIYENVWRGAKTVEHKAATYGVPSNAVAIQCVVYATATTASGAAIHLYKAGATHYKYGFICHAYGGNAANYGRSSAQGMVMLGEGAHAGKFIERRTASFETASIFVQGFFI